MGQIALSIPQVGQLDQTEDPKVANDFTILQAWANGNVDSSNLSAATCLSATVNQAGQTVKGAANISTVQTTSSTTYTTLSTPDQVTGIVLPSNGLIAVWYQAGWLESVSGAARAAIFIGSNQLVVQQNGAGPSTEAAATANGAAGNNRSLSTTGWGLMSGTGSGQSADVTTGQAVGTVAPGASLGYEVGGVVFSANPDHSGGPCYIFASAGTYTISVQFKVSSGTVTVGGRRLWAQALSFA